MSLHLVTGPANVPLTLSEVRTRLRVDLDTDDAQISRWIAEVTAEIDGALGTLGRCFVQQTYDLYIDGWPVCREIEIPLAPHVSTTSVKYLDTTETEQTLAADQYVTIPASLGLAIIRPAYGVTWPCVAWRRPDAVRVRFVAGHAQAVGSGLIVTDLATWEGIRGAMLDKIVARYDACSATDEEAADARLAKYKTWWF